MPQPSIVAAPVATPDASEFRLVDMSEGKVAPLPQFTVSSREVAAAGQSTLKFAPSTPVQPHATPLETAKSDSVDLRFKQLSSAPVAAPPRPVEAPLPIAPVAERESTTEAFATELFAQPPQTQASAFRPRIAMVVEHIPAPAPQHENAQPVRAAREVAPSCAAPAGTELFASGAPTIAPTAPQRWDLPTMDYGAALRQVQPEMTSVTKASEIEPRRVVARELPTSAAEMFGVGAPEPLLTQSAVKQPQQSPPLPIASAAPIVEQRIAPAAQLPVVSTPPRGIVEAKPVARPAVEPPVLSKVATSRPVAAAPIVAPAPARTVAASTIQLPPAANLDFSQVPALPEPKQHFAAAQPTRVASLVPASAPASQERLVPAAIATPVQSAQPFAYQAGTLTAESHVAEYKPAPAPPTAIPAPKRDQVVATVDPQDPNTYTFSLAATSGEPQAMFVNRAEPVVAEEVGPESIPNEMPAPYACNSGQCGQYGCPYLPGQSGTRALCGVDCGPYGSSCCSTWSDARCIPWALLGPGEYIGPARPAHVETYYLRVNDFLTLTFIESRKKSAEHYRIGVGDQLQIEWLQGASSTEKALDRNLLVQPDGTVTLPLIGEVNAAGKTVDDFREEVVKLYSKYQRDPQITVTPLTVNVAVQDVLKAVTSKNASSGQTQDVRVTPEGTIQAAGIGSVYVQGLTLDELRSELEARYAEAFGPGLAVSPQLTERATSYVFMGGEVRTPGRYVLEGPTTVMQAVALAGGWNNGGNLRQVVIFRRDENWCLKATKIDIRAPYYGKDPCPTNDVWLRDNDLVIVPKSCILCATDVINLYFTRGIYQVFPITYVYDLSQNTGLVPVP